MIEQESADPHHHKVGDKIRVRVGLHRGRRGSVCSFTDTDLEVQLDSGERIQLPFDFVTNFSRAARRAWQSMPKQAGRPKSSTPRKKMVSIRIDSDVWEELGRAVEDGLISSREHMINVWLRQHMEELQKER